MSSYQQELGERYGQPAASIARQDLAATCGQVRSIIAATAGYYDVQPWRIMEWTRLSETLAMRAVAVAVTRSRTGLSLPRIAKQFGGRHHTTIMGAIRRADRDAVAAICLVLDETRS